MRLAGSGRLAVPLFFAISALVLMRTPAHAQMDFSGEWAPVQDEDDTGDPHVGEFIGIPMSRQGRLRAEEWNASLHIAGMAVPPAWSHVHLARSFAGQNLERDRSGYTPIGCLSCGMASFG